MSSRLQICVYCSASSDVEDVYKQAAREMGALCGASGWDMVFGGGRAGLMGVAADSAMQAGASVTGVIPGFLKDREVAHEGITTLIITETIHARQQTMADLSDVFVILPGGLGTLAEFFEVLTWRQLGLHDKPIIVVNIRGYWDLLLDMISQLRAQNFLHERRGDLFQVTDSLTGLQKLISAIECEKVE